MSLQATEAECAANAVAPRVSLADIEAAIAIRYDTTADRAVAGADAQVAMSSPLELVDRLRVSLFILSICVLVMKNGFVIIGKSAPASAANFNPELGKKLAYEDAVRQIWPLMGFALRDRLAAAAG
jgi:hypothetical protein